MERLRERNRERTETLVVTMTTASHLAEDRN